MEGHCLCKKVTVSATPASNEVGACHCSMCRRWSGGPFIEIACGTDVAFAGDEHIAVYESSDWAQRGFCRSCGTHLFYRLKGSGEHMVPVGLFEETGDMKFTQQVFIDEKPAYYEFANPTNNMTGAELFALYAPPK